MATTQPWADLLDDEDRLVIERGKYGKTRGLGQRPVLLVIDCQLNYIGRDEPITEQQDEYPAGGGADAWRAVRNIGRLLPLAREANVPVIYSRNVAKQTVQFDGFQQKAGWDHRKTIDGQPGTMIVDEIAPQDGDVVVDKSYASLFWGTPILTYLVALRADSLIVTGVSTSGCVRATLVDGITRGFNAVVVEDATADRIKASHKVALLDIWMKYGDVDTTDVVAAYLRGLSR